LLYVLLSNPTAGALADHCMICLISGMAKLVEIILSDLSRYGSAAEAADRKYGGLRTTRVAHGRHATLLPSSLLNRIARLRNGGGAVPRGQRRKEPILASDR
jgi:hypothetical protein